MSKKKTFYYLGALGSALFVGLSFFYETFLPEIMEILSNHFGKVVSFLLTAGIVILGKTMSLILSKFDLGTAKTTNQFNMFIKAFISISEKQNKKLDEIIEKTDKRLDIIEGRLKKMEDRNSSKNPFGGV